MFSNTETLSELLSDRAKRDPDLPLYGFLTDGEAAEELLTCGELHRAALGVAARLRARAKTADRCLLLAPPGLDFIRGLFGSQYAGLITVATYPPHPRRVKQSLHRLQRIVASCEPSVAIVTRELLPVAEQLNLPAIIIEEATQECAGAEWITQVDPRGVAILQYTSGSTRDPRGVMLSHRNLVNNLQFIAHRFGHHPESLGVIWLPPYHDMGLIGGILQPLYVGFPVVLLNPLHVLQRPARWLNAITKYSATTSGGPNFAYDFCVDSLTEEHKQQLRLDSWNIAFCGAEPIRPQTWQRFSQAFSSCGLRREAFLPCYGLAEATLMVTGAQQLRLAQASTSGRVPNEGSSSSTQVISCGTAAEDHLLIIVDPESREELAEGEVGEIWVAGPSVALGYWNDPGATVDDFGAQCATREGEFLRTGDLGFVRDSELFVTGRLKELIIIAGRNVYPQDLEASLEGCHPAMQANGACVFSIGSASAERLIVVCELRYHIRNFDEASRAECCQAVRRALSSEHDVRYDELHFVRVGTIPRTTSGKKQRSQCRQMFETGELQRTAIQVMEFPVQAAAPSSRMHSNGIHVASQAARRTQQRLALIMVITPMLGLIAAIGMTWGTGIYLTDLLWLIGLYIATVLGVEVGFHRHFSHRAFQAHPVVRATLCILGSMAAQGPVMFWVATHRRHHAFSDQAQDPHSPQLHGTGWRAKIRGLWHAHVGWLFTSEVTNPLDYAPDILRDPLIFKLNRWYPLWVILGLAAPAFGGLAVTGTLAGLLRGFVWGGLVRILCVHHATWSVNSICHTFGQRPFKTRDQSTNNGWLVLTSLGGSWHNNHHAFPNSAYVGIRPWQFDPSGWLIRWLAWMGLAWDIKAPRTTAEAPPRELMDVHSESMR